jgi:hypothetical protein
MICLTKEKQTARTTGTHRLHCRAFGAVELASGLTERKKKGQNEIRKDLKRKCSLGAVGRRHAYLL